MQCESGNGEFLFLIDTFDNLWDTLFIEDNDKRNASRKYKLEEEISYFEQFGEFVDYLSVNNKDFPGEPVLTEVHYNKIMYEDERPFWLTDDSKNTTEPNTVQIGEAISTRDFVAMLVEFDGQKSFRIFQRFYQIYFSLFFEMSNDYNNMMNLRNFYSFNPKYTIEAIDVILDALKDTYLCYAISQPDDPSDRNGIITLNQIYFP